jgi:hypothetical protein
MEWAPNVEHLALDGFVMTAPYHAHKDVSHLFTKLRVLQIGPGIEVSHGDGVFGLPLRLPRGMRVIDIMGGIKCARSVLGAELELLGQADSEAGFPELEFLRVRASIDVTALVARSPRLKVLDVCGVAHPHLSSTFTPETLPQLTTLGLYGPGQADISAWMDDVLACVEKLEQIDSMALYGVAGSPLLFSRLLTTGKIKRIFHRVENAGELVQLRAMGLNELVMTKLEFMPTMFPYPLVD